MRVSGGHLDRSRPVRLVVKDMVEMEIVVVADCLD
jgi:hypothetical protein